MTETEPNGEAASDSTTTPGESATDRPGSASGSLAAIRETYAEQAAVVDRMERLDRLIVGRYRRRLFEAASGRVLDVACGTGTNARYLPQSVEYVGIDVSPEMLRRARERVAELGRDGTVLEMDAQALAFPDDSFDTVISSLSTCTFPDPVVALQEMGRVCDPDGQILLLEHGRSSVELIGRLQDWRADTHFEKHRCRLNQDPLAVVSRTELSVADVSTAMVGVITAIEATPP